jgi:hypothetical protein
MTTSRVATGDAAPETAYQPSWPWPAARARQTRRITHGQVRQHLAVHLDAAQLQAVHEARVVQLASCSRTAALIRAIQRPGTHACAACGPGTNTPSRARPRSSRCATASSGRRSSRGRPEILLLLAVPRNGTRCACHISLPAACASCASHRPARRCPTCAGSASAWRLLREDVALERLAALHLALAGQLEALRDGSCSSSSSAYCPHIS